MFLATRDRGTLECPKLATLRKSPHFTHARDAGDDYFENTKLNVYYTCVSRIYFKDNYLWSSFYLQLIWHPKFRHTPSKYRYTPDTSAANVRATVSPPASRFYWLLIFILTRRSAITHTVSGSFPCVSTKTIQPYIIKITAAYFPIHNYAKD